MKKGILESISSSSMIIAAAFLLIVVSAGYGPVSFFSGKSQEDSVGTNRDLRAAQTLQGEYCSLADFHQLTHNINSLRRGISTQHAIELAKYIWLAGARFDCDPTLIAALIQVESSFFSRARSHKGALGLMQIRPFVARELARQLETTWSGVQTLHDPETNILMGTYYLATLIRDFSDLPTALTAYNCGPSYVRRRLRRGQRLPTGYSVKIISLYQSFATNRS